MNFKGYTLYTFEKIDLNDIPIVFLVFSLLTKVTNFVKLPLFIGYLFLFFNFTKMN